MCFTQTIEVSISYFYLVGEVDENDAPPLRGTFIYFLGFLFFVVSSLGISILGNNGVGSDNS